MQTLIPHLTTCGEPFRVRRGSDGPSWSDAALHEAAWAQCPELYGLTATLERVQPGQRARILFQTLRSSWTRLGEDTRRLLDRCAAFCMAVLPADDVLQVFLALRRVRANHKHVTRAVMRYLLNHPEPDDLFLLRRSVVRGCIEHALGKNTARACIKYAVDPGPEGDRYLNWHALHWGRDRAQAEIALALLGKVVKTSPTVVTKRIREAHKPYVESLVRERPGTVTPTNRGDLAATLVHLYRGGPAAELEAGAERYAREAADRLPRFPGRIGVVLDASSSTKGYGDREYAILAQSVAFARVLALCAAETQVVNVGGSGPVPPPEGPTDLASALLQALEGEPDVVVILSDGYENRLGGDLERVVAALPGAGIRTPVYFCHSKFGHSDDLAFRRPTTLLPELELWHEADYEEILTALFAAGGDDHASLREYLRGKLETFEREQKPWTLPH